jgi:hypothetical protein
LRSDAGSCYPLRVSKRRAAPSRLRRERVRGLALWFLAPLLVVVQLLGGRGALVHAHDETGPHAHFLPAAASAGADTSWHAAAHRPTEDDHALEDVQARREHENEHEHDGDLPSHAQFTALAADASLGVPRGVLVDTSGDEFGAAQHLLGRRSIAFAGPPASALAPPELMHLRPPRAASIAPQNPSVRRERSGAALVLGSSRALRI